MSFVTRALAAGLIAIGVAGTARADVLYANLTSSQPANTTLYPYQQSPDIVGASFNTDGASQLNLTDIQLWLGGGGGNTPGSQLVVTLQTDSSGPSGTVLASWTAPDASLSWGVYDFHLTNLVNLASNTTYWVTAQDPGSAGWFAASPTFGSPQSGVGAIGNQNFVVGSGGLLNNSSQGQAQEMCVLTAGSACTQSETILATYNDQSAPEPASLAVLGVAVIGLGLARRYRKT